MESNASSPPPVMESTAAPLPVMESIPSYPPSCTSDYAIPPPSMEFAGTSPPSSTSDRVIPPSSVETTASSPPSSTSDHVIPPSLAETIASSTPSSTSDHSVPRCNVQHLLPVLRRVADKAGDAEIPVIFKDIRRYHCEYCGICRSKKSLIRSHILAHHKEKLPDAQASESKAEKDATGHVALTCQECGAKFKKPAYLQQHMQSHSLERPFACPLYDCCFSYRRKDHLTRHLLKHEGKTFTCPQENCNRSFAFQGNMKRHVNELHDCEGESPVEGEKQYACQEPGCGKKFKYASKLRKHKEMHAVKLDCIEVICCEPGCMKPFSNAECLRAHVQSCHQYVQCEICKTRQLKKNFKRHQRLHEECSVTERVKCSFSGCLCTFSKKSNLNKHVKAVHQELRPFTCRISGCGQKFTYRHVRDNHENCGAHVFIQEDFVEADEQWLSRPHGGRKRRVVLSEDLMRKRIVPPGHASPLDDGTEYLRWLLADDQQ